MIFIMSDLHGDRSKWERLLAEKNPQESDTIIVLGDFGFIWDKNTIRKDLSPFANIPFELLFVDGNHENFSLLNSFPIEDWRGGKTHRILPRVRHLMRGQIYEIEGKSFFSFGGATSRDKNRRIEGVSWWKEEVPSQKEFEEAKENLRKRGNQVDFILTHTCDTLPLYFYPLYQKEWKYAVENQIHEENTMLSYFENNVTYSHWYFGHWHKDGTVTSRKTAICNEIIQIIK